MKFAVITLFPEMFSSLTEYGVVGRAFKDGKVSLSCWNPRDFTTDKHQTVDDRPYGGGPGMLMRVEPLAAALAEAKRLLPKAKVIYLSPQGKQLNQTAVENFSRDSQDVILIAGRYEGIDERFISSYVDEEWSIGDYVLSGGELAAAVVIDAIVRLLPEVLGHSESAKQDSFSEGSSSRSSERLLDCPHYTRPENWKGLVVPDILLSGNHQAITRWREEQALQRTSERRPDLLNSPDLLNNLEPVEVKE